MWVSLLLCLGTCIGLAWYDSPSNTGVLPAGEIGTVGGASLRRSEVEGWAGYAASLLEISRVRVGMRVAAENPEVSDVQRKTFVDPDPTTWRILKLRLPKNQSTDAGSASSLLLTPALATDFVAIDLLRPLEWLEKQQAKVGGRVYLDLEELGAKGWAEVLEIGPCPEIVPGPGSVVTATFAHQPTSEILDVTINVGRQSPGGLTLDQSSSKDTSSSSGETIGVTANHPFWSVDHQAFIPIGQLQPGSLVKTHTGQLATITSLLPRPGPAEKVYNLEVHGEHVYYVGNDQLLVHNSGCGPEDTHSGSRNAALRSAKEANGIPRSAQPLRTIKPNTPEGNALKLDDRNVVLYEFINSSGKKIHIRLDKPASYGGTGGKGDQSWHFNAGPAFEKLKQHHYFDQ